VGAKKLGTSDDLSKSRFFVLKDRTLVQADRSSSDNSALERLPLGIIDQKYEILELIGEGGMGAVYRAHHLLLDKDVALKTFRSGNLSQEAHLRFQREAQAIARLDHKNVVQVYDFGSSGNGVPYYTMEYLVGVSLADRLQERGPLTEKIAVEYFIQICQGLALAHSKGIIHRDLKPANLFLQKTTSAAGTAETIKIVDFGIASLTDHSLDGQKITAHGAIFGSPLYMSPEQSIGEPVTARADIYSLGCTLFQTLSGVPPFAGATAIDTIMQHQTATPPTLKAASGGKDFSLAIERVIATMLAKSPEERQPSMESLATDLLQANQAQIMVDLVSAKVAQPSETDGNGSWPTDDTVKTIIPGRPRQKWLAAGAMLLLIGLAGSAGVWYWDSSHRNDHSNISEQSQPRPALAAITPKIRTVQKIQPIYKPETDLHGRKWKVFKFAPDLDLGTFFDNSPPGLNVHAIGEVKWPSYMRPEFRPSEDFLKDPSNIDIFAPDHVVNLSMGKLDLQYRNADLMRHILGLTGSSFLTLENFLIDDKDLAGIEKLHHLIGINLIGSDITGKALGKIPQLQNLECITFSSCQGTGDLITALKGSTKLRELYLDHDKLSPHDFEQISTISNLSILQVNGSGMTTAGLVSLSRLTKLRKLDAADYKFSEESMAPLRVLSKNGLHEFTLFGPKLDPLNLLRLKQMIPVVCDRFGGNTQEKGDLEHDLTNLAREKQQ
jgi:serine/threonine protein kinase